MSLNQAQIAANAHKDGPCMVLAGPGSGKTTVITNRIKHLIEKHKVKPEEILVITFSKAASKEMRDRFHALWEGKNAPVTFGTFHGIYYGILKWAYKLTSENIFSDEQKYQLLQRVVERMNLDIDDEKDFLSLAKDCVLALSKSETEFSEVVLCAGYANKVLYSAVVNFGMQPSELDGIDLSFDEKTVKKYGVTEKTILDYWLNL